MPQPTPTPQPVHRRQPRMLWLWGLSISLLGCVLTAPPALAQDGLLERIGNIIFGGAEDGFGADMEVIDVQEAVPFLPAAPGADGEDPTIKARAEKRRKRLGAWAANWQGRVADVTNLSEEQEEELQQLVDKRLDRAETLWRRQHANQQNSALTDVTPLRMTTSNGPVAKLTKMCDRDLADLLDDDQLERYREWTLLRSERQRNLFAERAMGVLCEDLFLTPQQYDQCLETVRKALPARTSGLYGLHGQTWYLPYESLSRVWKKVPTGVLSDLQQQRWKQIQQRMADDNGGMYVFLEPSSPKACARALTNQASLDRQRMLLATAVQAEYLATVYELPDHQARRLLVAGKGAAHRCVQQWKKQSREQLEMLRENNHWGPGNQMALNTASLTSLRDDDVWQHTLNTVRKQHGDTTSTQPPSGSDAGATAFLLASFDRELLLTEDQSTQLRELIAVTEPHLVNRDQYYILELAMLARTLVRIRHSDISEILNEQQLDIWKQQRRWFRFNGKDSAQVSYLHGDMYLNLTDR